jgi:hypothetical protein
MLFSDENSSLPEDHGEATDLDALRHSESYAARTKQALDTGFRRYDERRCRKKTSWIGA